MKDLQKVSCICVTRNRISKLKGAVACFKSQTYSNKEMIVVVEDDDLGTINFINDIDDKRIKLLIVDGSQQIKLGELRNLGIKVSNGMFFCQWDDDDWYHPKRIEYQITHALKYGHEAVVLTNWIIYNEKEKKAYYSYTRIWEGSLLARKSIFSSYQYQNLSKGEDTKFTNLLVEDNKIMPLHEPYLYLYRIHTKNTWEYDHMERMCQRSQPLSEECSRRIGSIMESGECCQEASEYLESPELLQELDFFHVNSWMK